MRRGCTRESWLAIDGALDLSNHVYHMGHCDYLCPDQRGDTREVGGPRGSLDSSDPSCHINNINQIHISLTDSMSNSLC